MAKKTSIITVSGMEALNLQVGDTIDMHNGTLYTITKVESPTRLHVGPASLWTRFRWWIMDMMFEIEMKFITWRRRWNEKRSSIR